MKTYESNLWSINLPDNWDEEHDDEGVTLFNPEGCGALEISVSEQEEVVDAGFLEYMAEEHLEAGAEPSEVEFGDFEGLEFSYSDEGNYWREWYLRADNLILYVTYHCPLADEGSEDDEVEAILETLALA